ncbi:MAG: DUF2203 domain-containing protein [Acidobacteria bacterium]|nr:DUF2203 domain-containing protein [Acidobacteriota bacterium]
MPRLFTLQEAEELLPTVERSLRTAIESKKSASQFDEQVNLQLVRINMSGGVQLDLNRFAEMKAGKEHALEQLKKALDEIETAGVLVKDLDIGLVDFPTLLDGQEVYLCWKLGESHIGFWHHTGEGFQGRKQIDRDFLERHQGGRPH